jgi:hypothetical protein
MLIWIRAYLTIRVPTGNIINRCCNPATGRANELQQNWLVAKLLHGNLSRQRVCWTVSG